MSLAASRDRTHFELKSTRQTEANHRSFRDEVTAIWVTPPSLSGRHLRALRDMWMLRWPAKQGPGFEDDHAVGQNRT